MKRKACCCSLAVLMFLIVGCGDPPALTQINSLASDGRHVDALKLCESELAKLDSGQRAGSKLSLKASSLRETIAGNVVSQAVLAAQGGRALPNVEKAIDLLKANLPYDNSAGRIKSQLSECLKTRDGLVRECSAKAQEAKTRESARLWTEAANLLGQALAINPSDPAVQGELKGLLERRNTFYRSSVGDALKKDDWREADKAIETFRNEIPKPDSSLVVELTALATGVKDRVLHGEIRGLCDKKKYYTAAKTIEVAAMGGRMDDLVRQVAADGSQYYLSAGEDALKKGLDGRAYVAAVKAMALSPKSQAAFELHKNASDKIDKALRIQIAVAAFDSPSKEATAGLQLSDALIVHLIRTLPYGIEILERSKIDVLLSEKGKRLDEVSRQLDVKFFIIGNVTALDVEHQKSEREATALVKIGMRSVPNPEYQAFVSQYGPDTDKWPRVPSATANEDVSQVVKYRIGDETVNGIMTASARVFDAAKGSVTFAENFKVQDQAVGHFQDGVETANIPVKSLQIPSDTEMKERLRKRMVDDVSKIILSLFEDRHVRLLQKANYHLERREYDQALNFLAQAHWYCQKDRQRVEKSGPNDKSVNEIARKALLDCSE